jgi:hypothetical protein
VGVWTALLGGGFGFYVASVYATPFRNLPSSEYYHGIALVMFLAWAVLLLVLTRGDSPEDSPRDIHLRRAGYLTGLCGLLMHSVLDFDLGVPGNAQTLWLIGGMVMAMAVPQARISLRLGHWGRLGLAMTALAGMMVLTSLLFPRLANSEVSKEHGRILFTGALSPNATKRLEDMKRADELLKEAGYDNPYDPESFFERGSVCQHLWAVTGQTEYAVEAYRSLRRANAIAPLRAGYHWRLGQLLELIAVNAPSVLETVVRPDYAGRETSHPVPPLFLPAMVEYDRTAELYPTKPLHLLPRADLLWRLGEKDKARALYNDILNLDRKILSRWRALRLTPEQRKEAEERSRDL